MRGLDYHFDKMLNDYLNQPEDPEPVPCPYCGHDLDADEECHNKDCPNE